MNVRFEDFEDVLLRAPGPISSLQAVSPVVISGESRRAGEEEEIAAEEEAIAAEQASLDARVAAETAREEVRGPSDSVSNSGVFGSCVVP